MKDVRFLYRDEGTNGEWREREGRFRDVAQAIEWYGLGEDCDYRMVAVFDHDKGSYEWTWLDDVEDLSGCVPLCKLRPVRPSTLSPSRLESAIADGTGVLYRWAKSNGPPYRGPVREEDHHGRERRE